MEDKEATKAGGGKRETGVKRVVYLQYLPQGN
jgi:hypothetical protein